MGEKNVNKKEEFYLCKMSDIIEKIINSHMTSLEERDMLQRIKKMWYYSDKIRILRLMVVVVFVAGCAIVAQHQLQNIAGAVDTAYTGAESIDLEDMQAKLEDKKRLQEEKRLEQEKVEAEEEAAEAAANAVQALTDAESHMAEIKAIEASILPGQYPIMGESSIQVSQMVSYFYENGGSYPSQELGGGGAPDIETFCQIYYDEAVSEGVRPEVAFAQTMKETGWLQYGGDASIAQFNFAGLGTTGGGVAGNSFADVRTGVRAQIQHLKAYATDQNLNQECVDGRYDYVTKGCAPFVEWLGQNENPEGYGWATGPNYGYDIVDMINAMRTF